MKKILVFMILLIAFGNKVSASENSMKDYGEYIVFENYNIYEVEGSKLMNFIDSPSIKLLDNVCLSKFKYIRYIKQSGSVVLSYKNFEGTIDNKEEMLIIRNPIFSEENLKYLSNKNMNNVLKSNGIDDEVMTVALIDFFWKSYDNCPIIVWINTISDENYYLIFEYEKVDGEFKGVPEFSKIKLSTQEEFEEKFKWEKGSLFINNTKVEGDLQPIFQGDTLRVPIREILEGYGFDVNWDMENKVILAYRDGIEYAILLGTDENMRRLKIDEYESDVIQVQFFESVFFKDDNIYVGVYDHLWELMGSLGVSGYKCNVDYNNKDVYLSGTINN